MKRFCYLCLLLTLPFVLTIGCNLEPYYEDLVGKNLLGDTALTEWHHTDTGTLGTADETYLDFQQVSASGGYNGSAAYRLELKNLMPDGDFESGSVGTAPVGWTESSVSTFVIKDSVKNITNKSMYYDLNTSGLIEYDMSQITDGLLSNTKYRIRLMMNIDIQGFFDVHDGSNRSIIGDPFWQTKTYGGWSGEVAFPDEEELNTNITIPSSGNAEFSINSPDPSASNTTQEGYIDNFSIVKAHGDYGIAFEINSDTAPSGDTLEPGTYRFSVYIKEEASGDVTPNTGNRFHSDFIAMSIKGPTSSTGAMISEAVHSKDDSWSSSEWTELSVDSASLRPEASDAPIILAVFPYNPSERYSGSILISAPRLEYVP